MRLLRVVRLSIRLLLITLFFHSFPPLPSRAQAADELRVVDPTGITLRTISASGTKLDFEPAAASPAQTSRVYTEASIPIVEADAAERASIDLADDAPALAMQSAVQTGAETASASDRITIDGITLHASSALHTPAFGLAFFNSPPLFTLSDGSAQNGEGGFHQAPHAYFDRVEVEGSTVRYSFFPPASGYLFSFVEYQSETFASSGSFGAAGPLVLEARIGSTTGRMSGELTILSNYPEDDSEPRYHFFSAPVGAIVPFEVTLTLEHGRTFDAATFETAFSFAGDAWIDLASSRRPPLVNLEIAGDSQIVAGATTTFPAIATYEGGLRENVSSMAEWSVQPDAIASIDRGDVMTAADGCDGERLTIRARYVLEGRAREATKAVDCRNVLVDGSEESWETFQGDARHSGYVPVALDPSLFALRWQKEVAPGFDLNPLTAADGKVFVSAFVRFSGGEALFALDGRTGERLWSRGFGQVNSVNPPAYGYGNVYIQTGNHANDTYLWALDAESGSVVFQSPHSAQWERYYAPTILEGGVYVNGGFYGGVYAFDAFTGASRWFAALPFSDEFTPAVDDQHAYAYVGEDRPGLYVFDRGRGRPLFQIEDPSFEGSGFSIDLAPVLGSQNDVLVIQNGRLMKFDLAERRISFEIDEAFVGQPSVARGVVYAINLGAVEARNESSGVLIWRWAPTVGVPSGPMVVTDSHVLVRVGDATHVLDVSSGQSEWSYPVGGHMALADDTLYVASRGKVTAIAMPGFGVAPPIRLEITGAAITSELGTTRYGAYIHYADGRVRDRTGTATWSVESAGPATIDSQGLLNVAELMRPTETAIVRARYAERGVEVTGELQVELQIGVSIDHFVARNVSGAIEAQNRAEAALGEAIARESVAISIAASQAGKTRGAGSVWRNLLAQLKQARIWTTLARQLTERSTAALEGRAPDAHGSEEGAPRAP